MIEGELIPLRHVASLGGDCIRIILPESVPLRLRFVIWMLGGSVILAPADSAIYVRSPKYPWRWL